jgi:hypothetical protein
MPAQAVRRRQQPLRVAPREHAVACQGGGLRGQRGRVRGDAPLRRGQLVRRADGQLALARVVRLRHRRIDQRPVHPRALHRPSLRVRAQVRQRLRVHRVGAPLARGLQQRRRRPRPRRGREPRVLQRVVHQPEGRAEAQPQPLHVAQRDHLLVRERVRRPRGQPPHAGPCSRQLRVRQRGPRRPFRPRARRRRRQQQRGAQAGEPAKAVHGAGDRRRQASHRVGDRRAPLAMEGPSRCDARSCRILRAVREMVPIGASAGFIVRGGARQRMDHAEDAEGKRETRRRAAGITPARRAPGCRQALRWGFIASESFPRARYRPSTRNLPVHEGGLRVVVAANSFALSRCGTMTSSRASSPERAIPSPRQGGEGIGVRRDGVRLSPASTARRSCSR